jgi:hypothetical protein
LKGVAALGSASGACGCAATTTTTTRKGNGGRKKRESENRERDGASTGKHLDFFVERRNCLKSRTGVCSTAESISSVASFIHF